MTEFAQTVIENKDTVNYIEKIGKTVVILGLLFYMVVSSEDLKNDKGDQMGAFKKLGDALTNSFIYTDFMKREGIILFVVVGGYLLANKYN